MTLAILAGAVLLLAGLLWVIVARTFMADRRVMQVLSEQQARERVRPYTSTVELVDEVEAR